MPDPFTWLNNAKAALIATDWPNLRACTWDAPQMPRYLEKPPCASYVQRHKKHLRNFNSRFAVLSVDNFRALKLSGRVLVAAILIVNDDYLQALH